jgi:hypothetical protein
LTASDLLDRMRRNPAADWQIRDVEAVCSEHGLLFRPGKGTSHCHAKLPLGARNSDDSGSSADQAVYIRKLVRYIESHGASK